MARATARSLGLVGAVVCSFSATLGCEVILGLRRAERYTLDGGTGGHGGEPTDGGHGGSSHCSDGKQDGDESDVDCGGICPACGDGKHCNVASDCQSMTCAGGVGGVCVPACVTPPCPGDALWAERFGDSAEQRAQSVAAVAKDVVVAGWFSGSVDFGGGPLAAVGSSDVFLAKLDAASGGHVWSMRFGGDTTSYQYGEGVAIDGSGNVLVVGEFSDQLDLGGGPLQGAGHADIFLGKLNPSGGHVWSMRFGDAANQYGAAVATDPAGGTIITGRNEGTVNFGGSDIVNPTAGTLGGGSAYVAKFDGSGKHVWSHGYGDGSDQYGVSVATDKDNNVLVLTTGGGSFDFGKGSLAGMGGSDFFIAKLGPNGTCVWSKQFGDQDVQYGEDIATDAQGNVFVLASGAGSIDFGNGPLAASGTEDVFVAKLDPSGAPVWSRRYGYPNGTAMGASLVVDSGGNVFVTGSFSGKISFGKDDLLESAGQTDAFLVKLTSDGAVLWSRRYGDDNDQTATALAFAGNIFLTGYFGGAIDFGTGILTSKGKDDVFVAKVSP